MRAQKTLINRKKREGEQNPQLSFQDLKNHFEKTYESQVQSEDFRAPEKPESDTTEVLPFQDPGMEGESYSSASFASYHSSDSTKVPASEDDLKSHTSDASFLSYHPSSESIETHIETFDDDRTNYSKESFYPETVQTDIEVSLEGIEKNNLESLNEEDIYDDIERKDDGDYYFLENEKTKPALLKIEAWAGNEDPPPDSFLMEGKSRVIKGNPDLVKDIQNDLRSIKNRAHALKKGIYPQDLDQSIQKTLTKKRIKVTDKIRIENKEIK